MLRLRPQASGCELQGPQVQSVFDKTYATWAECNESGRQVPQNWNTNQRAQLPRDTGEFLLSEHIRHQVLLDKRLHPLHHARGPLPAALHLGQVGLGNAARFQWAGENV